MSGNWLRLGLEGRLGAAAFAGVLAIMLAVAAWLEPDPSGVGTHTQLGLPPTFVMEYFGTPCPFCGMTTAWAHTMDADLPGAVTAQPTGTLAALLAILSIPALLAMALSGWYPAVLNHPLMHRWGLRFALAALAAGWVYKLGVVRFGLLG